MRALFRARAEAGITPREVDKREAAVRAALAGESHLKPLPPPMPHFGGKAETAGEPEAAAPLGEVVKLAADIAPEVLRAPVYRREPDRPVITITITGPEGAGKSVLAHLIRYALADRGIAVSGPDELRSIPWRRAADDLVRREIAVVLEKREAGA